MSTINTPAVQGNAAPAAQLNEDELRSMMNDERYWKQGSRDQGFIKQVNDGFAKLYQQ